MCVLVRIAAAEGLPFLIDCAKIKGDQYVADMWAYICPNLIKAIETEPENDILGEDIHALAKVRHLSLSVVLHGTSFVFVRCTTKHVICLCPLYYTAVVLPTIAI